MKIKKLGEIPEEDLNKEIPEINSDFDKINFQIPKNTSVINKNYMIYGSIIFIALIGFVLYFFVIKDSGNENENSILNSTEYEDIKRKELELKERELKLREKQLSGSANTESQQNSAGATNFENQASVKISEWINSIGSSDKSAAYYLMKPEKRGDFSRFNSIKGYGGITRTQLFSCNTVLTSGCTAQVIAEYESIDPYNKSGKFTQRFFINNCSGNWIITDIKNMNIENY